MKVLLSLVLAGLVALLTVSIGHDLTARNSGPPAAMSSEELYIIEIEHVPNSSVDYWELTYALNGHPWAMSFPNEDQLREYLDYLIKKFGQPLGMGWKLYLERVGKWGRYAGNK